MLILALASSAHAQVSGVDLLRTNTNNAIMGMPQQNRAVDDTYIPSPVTVPSMDIEDDEPVTFESDEVGYDKDNHIVVARGNVQVVQGAYVLNADQITYFQQRDLMKATGNVSMLQPTGDVYFADTVELKNRMKQGVIYNFRARLADNSVFAAEEARKINQNVTELKHAVYTPCKLCDDMEPFWQVKASDVQIDEGDERIRYANARMEFWGVPTFYTPAFSHPTPDSEAKSGFLTPDYSTNGQLGTVVRAPYYWRIAPNIDATITPWYTTEGAVLEGDYRQLNDDGSYHVNFSGTNPDQIDAQGNKISGNDFRGHIYADGEKRLTEHSRVGFNIARTTDDTYQRRYGFGNDRSLFSRVFAESVEGRNYASAQGLAIQGLRQTDDPSRTPLVLPTLEGYYETEPDAHGLTLHAFGNAQSLTREEGVDQHRLSVTAGATLPMITDNGHVFTATANLRQDIYESENVPLNNGTQFFDGSTLRTLPQAALEWRYPLIQAFDGDAMTIEPVVLAVAQTNGGNSVQISNEENTLIELTDTNLFSLNRMPGLDTVDSGSRVAYGFRSQYLFARGQSVDTLLGQAYNVDADTPFPNSVLPDEHFSDLIGRVSMRYQPFTVAYRFAYDKSDFNANRTEFSLGFSKPWFSIDAVYRALDDNQYLFDSQEGILSASAPITDSWSIFGGLRRDLELDQMVATSGGLLYRNECFNMMLQTFRSYTRDRDVEPTTAFMFRVGFKNLGEFGGD